MKEKKTFISKRKVLISAIISLMIEFYAFNFVPKNIKIIASRSFSRQIFDYVLNFIIFFVGIYLLLTLLTYLIELIVPKSRR